MSNPFRTIQERAFNAINKLMGPTAIWNGVTYGCLFKDPTGTSELGDVIDYDPSQKLMEYKGGDFPGLFESARSGNLPEVDVDGIVYVVRTVHRAWDGLTFKANLELKNI